MLIALVELERPLGLCFLKFYVGGEYLVDWRVLFSTKHDCDQFYPDHSKLRDYPSDDFQTFFSISCQFVRGSNRRLLKHVLQQKSFLSQGEKGAEGFISCSWWRSSLRPSGCCPGRPTGSWKTISASLGSRGFESDRSEKKIRHTCLSNDSSDAMSRNMTKEFF